MDGFLVATNMCGTEPVNEFRYTWRPTHTFTIWTLCVSDVDHGTLEIPVVHRGLYYYCYDCTRSGRCLCVSCMNHFGTLRQEQFYERLSPKIILEYKISCFCPESEFDYCNNPFILVHMNYPIALLLITLA